MKSFREPIWTESLRSKQMRLTMSNTIFSIFNSKRLNSFQERKHYSCFFNKNLKCWYNRGIKSRMKLMNVKPNYWVALNKRINKRGWHVKLETRELCQPKIRNMQIISSKVWKHWGSPLRDCLRLELICLELRASLFQKIQICSSNMDIRLRTVLPLKVLKKGTHY